MATSSENDPSTVGDDLVEDITVDPSADLVTTKVATSTGPYLAGSNVVYQLEVTNNGPDAATTVTLTDLCPTGTTYVSDVPSSGAYVSATGAWDVPTIANAGSETLDLTCVIDAATTSGIVNNTTTAATSAENDPSTCLLYTSPSPRDQRGSRMPSSA